MGLTARYSVDLPRLAEFAARAPKAGRHELYTALTRLYQLQGAQLSEREQALMRDILERLTPDAGAERACEAEPEAGTPVIEQAVKPVVQQGTPDARDGSRKLVDKLARSGQLRAGFLLRVLQQGRIDLFDTAFAKLLDVEETLFCEVFYRRGPRPVALACRAAGIDRCVFPTVYRLSRQSRRMHCILSADDRVEVESIFEAFSRTDARGLLQRMAS